MPSQPSMPGLHHFSALRFVTDWEVNFHIVRNWDALTRKVLQGQGYAVSDSSFKTNQGTAVWIIEGASSANRVIGECFTPGWHG